MPKHYQSFLVRLWNVNEIDERIEIEHIQSGHRRILRSRDEAVEWMRTIELPCIEKPGKEDTGNRPPLALV